MPLENHDHVPETPSQSIAKTAATTATAYDAKGRLITVTRLNALQYFRLTKALGETSNNAASMEMAILASSVCRIDATPIAVPATEREVEFLIQQLDFHGLTAVGEAMKKLSDTTKTSVDAAKN